VVEGILQTEAPALSLIGMRQ